SGYGITISWNGYVPVESALLKTPAAEIAKQESEHAVVGHKQIDEPVFVEIGRDRRHSFTRMGGYARRLRYVRKCAIAIVSEQRIRLRIVEAGMTEIHFAIDQTFTLQSWI